MGYSWTQHPLAKLDYDVTLVADDGDTFTGAPSPSVDVQPPGAIAVDSIVAAPTGVKVWLDTAVDGQTADVTVTASTTLGRTIVVRFQVVGSDS